MRLWVVAMFCLLAATDAASQQRTPEEEEKLEQIKTLAGRIGAQTMALQGVLEENIRASGMSGLKTVRNTIEGTRPYHAGSHIAGHTIGSIHDHSNNEKVVGLGEMVLVLNGVEFRTRHNDYHLNMPTTVNKWYHQVLDIDFPDVPPAVLNKATVEQQAEEMRAWFKAWADQDYSVRDYRPYFKPIISYVEGAYTNAGNEVDESFESDRHHLEAATWHELQDKIRFTAHTGRKSLNENLAFLPTTIMELVDGVYPVYAQWNYRILCHPLEHDLPLNRLRMADDLQYRMARNVEYDNVGATRSAHYKINPVDSDTWAEGSIEHNFLDDIMSQIPGKDNYNADIVDDAYGENAMDWKNESNPINAGYYNRWYRAITQGVSGNKKRNRGFSDENVYYALNTRPQIPQTKFTVNGKEYKQKVSFAIPLEIIYVTPLWKWNPYNVPNRGKAHTASGQTVSAGRNGGLTPEKAYNGTNSRLHYRTPAIFFNGIGSGGDAADTSGGIVGVLDEAGNMHQNMASGVYIHMPEIEGVGVLRQRYPIMPIHGQGSSEWQELEALKDIVLKSQTYKGMKRE